MSIEWTADASSDPAWHRVLTVAPSLLWPFLVLFVLLLFRREIRSKLSDLTSVKTSMFEATFAETLKDAQPNVQMPAADRLGAIARAERARERCTGKRILWVDDHAGNNHVLGNMFERLLGVNIVYSPSTDEALRSLLANARFAMVISDMARGDDPEAGANLVQQMRAEHVYRPTVIYCGQERPVPPGAFGLTNRPDELLHLIIDVCERDWARDPVRK
jgi:CheY-like chemotaxis protein